MTKFIYGLGLVTITVGLVGSTTPKITKLKGASMCLVLEAVHSDTECRFLNERLSSRVTLYGCLCEASDSKGRIGIICDYSNKDGKRYYVFDTATFDCFCVTHDNIDRTPLKLICYISHSTLNK